MKNKMIGFKIYRALLGPLFRFWYKPKIIGKENIPVDGPIVLAGNHRHLYDQCMIIIATKRVIHYMAKKEYFKGAFRWFFKSAGCIPVDRTKKDPNAKRLAMEVLNDKEALGIFPEGTRNKTDKLLLPFKYGAVSLAQKGDAVIVPFGISGDYKFRSGITIKIGKPFKVGDDLEKANKRLEREVTKLITS